VRSSATETVFLATNGRAQFTRC